MAGHVKVEFPGAICHSSMKIKKRRGRSRFKPPLYRLFVLPLPSLRVRQAMALTDGDQPPRSAHYVPANRQTGKPIEAVEETANTEVSGMKPV